MRPKSYNCFHLHFKIKYFSNETILCTCKYFLQAALQGYFNKYRLFVYAPVFVNFSQVMNLFTMLQMSCSNLIYIFLKNNKEIG